MSGSWLALAIGNSRLHWAVFRGQKLLQSWHTAHLSSETASILIEQGFHPACWAELSQSPALSSVPAPQELWLASVVPQQTAIWQRVGTLIEPNQIPLKGQYSGLGLDRVLTLWGAASSVGWPVMVIDAGTALTFTVGNAGAVLGGAILPGLRLQAQALSQGTAVLPAVSWDAAPPLARWATDTPAAIQAGILYTLLAGLRDYLDDWWQAFPQGKAILTGGDAPLLYAYLQQRTPEVTARVRLDPALIFRGICAYRETIVGAEY